MLDHVHSTRCCTPTRTQVCGASVRPRHSTGSNEPVATGIDTVISSTRAGTVDVAIPKLRQGSYFRSRLLEQGAPDGREPR